MRNIIRWIGIGLLGLMTLSLLAAGVFYLTTSQRLNKVYALVNSRATFTTRSRVMFTTQGRAGVYQA